MILALLVTYSSPSPPTITHDRFAGQTSGEEGGQGATSSISFPLPEVVNVETSPSRAPDLILMHIFLVSTLLIFQ